MIRFWPTLAQFCPSSGHKIPQNYLKWDVKLVVSDHFLKNHHTVQFKLGVYTYLGYLVSIYYDSSSWDYMRYQSNWLISFNTLRPRQNGRHFADDIFKCIFLNENVWISIKISLKFVPKGPIYNIPALVQIMAWPRPGDKPLSEPMMVNLLMHICVSRPQWVKIMTGDSQWTPLMVSQHWFR